MYQSLWIWTEVEHDPKEIIGDPKIMLQTLLGQTPIRAQGLALTVDKVDTSQGIVPPDDEPTQTSEWLKYMSGMNHW